ncbi:methyl-accepting chemotaxis protein [Undibacterium sp.]|uniref:methyl-accepting chemotaxis protein n=1 Tax=Undibacterium sp. TaxID=1914977 RepID=UPI00374C9BD1
MNVNNIKIGPRLGLAFGAILILLLAVAYSGWHSLADAKKNIDIITRENNVKISLANNLRGDLNLVARSVRNYIIYQDPETRQKMLGRITGANKDYDESSDKIGALISTDKARQIFASLKQDREKVRPLFDNLIKLIDSGKAEEAPEYLRQSVQPLQDKWFETIQGMVTLQEEQNQAAVNEVNQGYDFAVKFLIGCTLIALSAGGILAWLITRSITRPIDNAVKIAQTVASGDLTSKIEITSTDETGQLLQALKDMNTSLVNIVGQVRAGTDTIATASEEIAAGNLDLSARTEEQASSLEETASSMEELTSTVKHNADNARQANQLASNASDIASRGGSVVGEVVNTMGSINESSKKIVDIISVIDGIAFQTNILALNAAVEAARAGEQGRGFAVVASEVRNLAQRSASAAKEIKQLINDSVEKVETGTRLVDQAGATMHEVVNSVKRVSDIITEITAAGQEQTAGIEQINQAVLQMDQVTQQNAALVEEAAAAAESLQDQAGKLAELVSVFKMDGLIAAAPRPASQLGASPAPAAKRAPVLQNSVRRPSAKVSPIRRVAPPSATPAAAATSADNGQWEEF